MGNIYDPALGNTFGPRQFDLWINDDTTMTINPINEIIGNILTDKAFCCNFSPTCQQHFISIGPLGDVYPCGRFDGINEFKLGNINTDNLNEMLNSPIRNDLLKRSPATVKGCNSCEFMNICNAGCVHNAYMSTGNIMSKDFYCTGYKLIFSHIKNFLNNELQKALINNKIEEASI